MSSFGKKKRLSLYEKSHKRTPRVQLKKKSWLKDSTRRRTTHRCQEVKIFTRRHSIMNFYGFVYTFCWSCFCLLCWNSRLCIFKAARTDTIFQCENMENNCIFGFFKYTARSFPWGGKKNKTKKAQPPNKPQLPKVPESVHHLVLYLFIFFKCVFAVWFSVLLPSRSNPLSKTSIMHKGLSAWFGVFNARVFH